MKSACVGVLSIIECGSTFIKNT